MPQKSSNCLVDDADKAATKNLPKKCRGILRCFGLTVYKYLQFRKRGPNHVVSFVVNPCASLMVFLILMCFLSSKLFFIGFLEVFLKLEFARSFGLERDLRNTHRINVTSGMSWLNSRTSLEPNCISLRKPQVNFEFYDLILHIYLLVLKLLEHSWNSLCSLLVKFHLNVRVFLSSSTTM